MVRRAETTQARTTDSHGSEFCKRSTTQVAIRREQNTGKIGGCPTGNPNPTLRTSEDARHRTPSGHAYVSARRAFSTELDILRAFAAEDGPHSRRREKKHQLRRWAQYSWVAFFRQFGVNHPGCFATCPQARFQDRRASCTSSLVDSRVRPEECLDAAINTAFPR